MKEKRMKALDKVANPIGSRPFSPIGNIQIDLANTKSLSPQRKKNKNGKFVSANNDLPY